MSAQSQPLHKLQEHEAKIKGTEYGQVTVDGDEEDYAARLSKSLQSLQNQVKQYEAALEKLRATTSTLSIDEPSHDPKQHLQQLRTITAAYRSVTSSEPLLPSPGSPLPALLALRKTLNMVDQSKNAVAETKVSLATSRMQFQQENTDLRDARSITQALEARIENIKLQNEEQLGKSAEESAKDIIQEQQRRKHHYVTALKELVKAFQTFVDEKLAAMLAAEDLGGPVVGDLVQIDEEMLRAGFNQQGKAKKTDAGNATTEAKRRSRNDKIWGFDAADPNGKASLSEKDAAQASFRSLTDDLLNAATGEDNSDPYIKISGESAAVRFLIRAKVAQFHPEDARKLRLVDLGREWDD
ncbi:hypothetical protein BDR22DRAFT_886430 [Usnea florida]